VADREDNLRNMTDAERRALQEIDAVFNELDAESQPIMAEIFVKMHHHDTSPDQSEKARWKRFQEALQMMERFPSLRAMEQIRHHLEILWGNEFCKDLPFAAQ